MWLYRTSGCTENPIVLYDYCPNRKAENAERFLKEFKGYLKYVFTNAPNLNENEVIDILIP